MHSNPAEHVALLDRLIPRTMALLETEYPNAIRLDLRGEMAGPITPRTLHPSFYGCYDWHSAVHSVWQVVRAVRVLPEAPWASSVPALLDRLLDSDRLAVELAWVRDRPGFEMPYGMAWLVRLAAELRSWEHGSAPRWHASLAPLRRHALDRFARLCEQLPVPVRGGTHQQSAFSLGLVWDGCDGEAEDLRASIADAATRWFADDTDADLRFEPSATDFLSPALAEADLMRRVMPTDGFGAWWSRFLPDGIDALRPVSVVDPSDGQLAHWAGLNLSRSWMATSIADALPAGHPHVADLHASAAAHADAGLAVADHDHVMISHWVPTFAVRVVTGGEPR